MGAQLCLKLIARSSKMLNESWPDSIAPGSRPQIAQLSCDRSRSGIARRDQDLGVRRPEASKLNPPTQTHDWSEDADH